VGLAVVGAAEVGFTVVGAAEVGFTVVGAAEVGLAVVGAAVVGLSHVSIAGLLGPLMASQSMSLVEKRTQFCAVLLNMK